MQKINTVICIGNGTEEADILAQDIALVKQLPYHGILDAGTEIEVGVYHTSIFDIKLQELRDMVSDNTEIVMLDQTEYDNPRDYHRTLDMGLGLEDRLLVEFQNPLARNPIRQMVDQNPSLCILPFISVYQNENKVKGCGFMHDNRVTDQIIDIDTVKSKMLAGELVDECTYCYRLDDMNIISPRKQRTIDWAHRLNVKTLEELAEQTIVDYSIRLNNECNALCRTCAPSQSNLISREYFKLHLTPADVGNTELPDYSIIDIHTAKRVYISGGEPTIQSTTMDFLQRCIDENCTDFEIVINTNGAVVSDKFLKLARQFSLMTFEISIDGYGEVNRYIRWPIPWDKFANNIKSLYDVAQGRLSFNTTVSIYNISNLYSIFEFLENTYPHSRYNAGILLEPYTQVPWNFADKNTALADLQKIRTLNTYKKYEVFKSQIDAIIDTLAISEVDYNVLRKFFEFNDRLDASRDVKLQDYIPELEACRNLIPKQI